MLIQEFVDSSAGIPAIVEGVHDVRAFVFGETVWYYAVRQAQGEDFRCNVHQWGTTRNILPDQIPVHLASHVQQIIDKVNTIIDSKTNIYSIDFFVDAQGNFRLIELNSNPGWQTLQGDPLFMQLHADLLLGVCERICAK